MAQAETTPDGAGNPAVGQSAPVPKGTLWLTAWVCLLFLPVTVFVSLAVIFGITTGWISVQKCHDLSSFWARLPFRLAGIKPEIHGPENLDDLTDEGGYLIAANHRSALDIILLMGFLPANVVYLAKHSLFKIPFMGKAMAAIGHLPVYRGQSDKTIGLLKNAAKAVKAGATVAVFPEGTRKESGPGLLPFKLGVFVLARLAKRPVVPAAIVGTRELFPPKSRRLARGPVEIRIGQPINPADFPGKDPSDMARVVRSALLELMGEAEDPAIVQAEEENKIEHG